MVAAMGAEAMEPLFSSARVLRHCRINSRGVDGENERRVNVGSSIEVILELLHGKDGRHDRAIVAVCAVTDEGDEHAVEQVDGALGSRLEGGLGDRGVEARLCRVSHMVDHVTAEVDPVG